MCFCSFVSGITLIQISYILYPIDTDKLYSNLKNMCTITNCKSTCYVLNTGMSSCTVNLAPATFLTHMLVFLAVCRPGSVWYLTMTSISFMAEPSGQQFLMSNRRIMCQKS